MDKYYNSIPQCVEYKLIFNIETLDDLKESMHDKGKKLSHMTIEELEELIGIFHVCKNLREEVKKRVKIKADFMMSSGMKVSYKRRVMLTADALLYYAHNSREVYKIKASAIDAWFGYESRSFSKILK